MYMFIKLWVQTGVTMCETCQCADLIAKQTTITALPQLVLITCTSCHYSYTVLNKSVTMHESWTPCFFMSIPTIKYHHT